MTTPPTGAYRPPLDGEVRERERAALWDVMASLPVGTDLPSALWGAAMALQAVRGHVDIPNSMLRPVDPCFCVDGEPCGCDEPTASSDSRSSS